MIQVVKICLKHKPDAILSFSRISYLYPILLFFRIPVIKRYGRYISKKTTSIAKRIGGKKITFIAIAQHMIKHLDDNHKWNVVYNFTDTDYFTYDENKKPEYLFFLGRIEDIKGTKEAVEVAIKSQQKLIIAGNIEPAHQEYFNQFVKPDLSNPLISYVGPVNDEQKKEYLQKAKALLFPIKWEEPYGIVMAESLACGTPVIGFRRGSVPEVVKDGYNGFVVENVSEMVMAVDRLEEIDRANVRKDAERRFSLPVISKEYLKIINNQINQLNL